MVSRVVLVTNIHIKKYGFKTMQVDDEAGIIIELATIITIESR